MTFMALVSADRRAVSKPFTTSSSEKPRRWVTRGRTSTFLLANRLRHSGYCSQYTTPSECTQSRQAQSTQCTISYMSSAGRRQLMSASQVTQSQNRQSCFGACWNAASESLQQQQNTMTATQALPEADRNECSNQNNKTGDGLFRHWCLLCWHI